MRRALSPVAAIAVGTVLTSMLLPSGSAFAATSDDCVKSRSTRLFSSGPNDEDRLWVDQPSSTRVMVCFRMESLTTGGLTIIADSSSTVTLPNVYPGTDPLACPQEIRHITDPVDVRLAVNTSNDTVCISVGGSTTSVQFVQGNVSGALPLLQIWRDGGPDWGWIDVAACPVAYALAVAPGINGPTTCMETNQEIFSTI